MLCEKAARRIRSAPIFLSKVVPDSPIEITPTPIRLIHIPHQVVEETFSLSTKVANKAVIKFPPFTIKHADPEVTSFSP